MSDYQRGERQTVKGFTYWSTCPGINMGSYEVARGWRVLGTVSRLDSSENGPAGWDCEAGFFRTRHEAAKALHNRFIESQMSKADLEWGT